MDGDDESIRVATGLSRSLEGRVDEVVTIGSMEVVAGLALSAETEPTAFRLLAMSPDGLAPAADDPAVLSEPVEPASTIVIGIRFRRGTVWRRE